MRPGPLRNIICALGDIGDGLIVLLTLGHYHPKLGWKLLTMMEINYLKRMVATRQAAATRKGEPR
jgi:hypothetical protein